MFSDADKMVASTLAAAMMSTNAVSNPQTAVQVYAQVIATMAAKGMVGVFTAGEAKQVGAEPTPSIFDNAELWQPA